MGQIETDYLVIGAGASGMSLVDALIEQADVDVVMVDRRHRPGGHWLDAYPFVRLHQPSANYGVNSRPLGANTIDGSGYYERATAGEICDYFCRVMDERFVPSGKVRFLPMSDYRGQDGDAHSIVSLMSGDETTVKVRRKAIDATYVESEIPSRAAPRFEVDADVRLIPPNDLVRLDEAPTGYTVIGAGKTSMDTCNWLLENGVDPDRIRWVRPRDPWVFDRAGMQPLDQVGSYMQLQASWVNATADATGPIDFAHRMEASGVFARIDESIEPDMFRGAILESGEIASLRRISNVVRMGKVKRVGTDTVVLDDGTIASDPKHVYINCSASGIRPTETRPIFEPGRITMQYVTIGIVPWSAATIGMIEGARDDDDSKNALCPPVTFSGQVGDILTIARQGMLGLMARGMDPEVGAWTEASRLNPASGAANHMDDPRVAEAFGVMASRFGEAMSNLDRLVGASAAV